MTGRDFVSYWAEAGIEKIEALLHAINILKPRCVYSDLPILTCAHCQGHELDPDLEAAIEHY